MSLAPHPALAFLIMLSGIVCERMFNNSTQQNGQQNKKPSSKALWSMCKVYHTRKHHHITMRPKNTHTHNIQQQKMNGGAKAIGKRIKEEKKNSVSLWQDGISMKYCFTAIETNMHADIVYVRGQIYNGNCSYRGGRSWRQVSDCKGKDDEGVNREGREKMCKVTSNNELKWWH